MKRRGRVPEGRRAGELYLNHARYAHDFPETGRHTVPPTGETRDPNPRGRGRCSVPVIQLQTTALAPREAQEERASAGLFWVRQGREAGWFQRNINFARNTLLLQLRATQQGSVCVGASPFPAAVPRSGRKTRGRPQRGHQRGPSRNQPASHNSFSRMR